MVGSSAIFVQAGTALSTRGRGETNSFNVIRTEPSRISVEKHAWDAAGHNFTLGIAEEFRRTSAGWSRA